MSYSLAQLLAFVLGFVGLILGIIYGIGGAIYDVFHGQVGFGTVLALGAIIIMPILFAVFGFVVGVIGVFLYNLVAE